MPANHTRITATGVSAGIAIGKAHLVTAVAISRSGGRLASGQEIAEAIVRFDNAVSAAVIEVESLAAQPGRVLTEEEQGIIETQVEFMTDPQLRENVVDKISNEKMPVADAVLDSIAGLVAQFGQMEDEYLRARAADIADIGSRIAAHLVTTGQQQPGKIPTGAVLVATDISPSEAIALDLAVIAGFVTRVGGKTSHTALLARAKSIPAVVGCGPAMDSIVENDLLIVNGATGEIFINPDASTLEDYSRQQTEDSLRLAARRARGRVLAKTGDGTPVKLMMNIAGPEDFESPGAAEADGVGLYRTEMLYMSAERFPPEEEQLEQYARVMAKAAGRPVIFRTMDIGGDKPLPYFPFPAEQNPFLGYRAIRFSLDRKDIFLIQLRAILRAAVGGNAGIMFPMIGSVAECRAARSVLDQAKLELLLEGIAYNKEVKTGIMIEIPAAALIADWLAAGVDFFSIGTNDLCQYTLAVDRTNETVSELYNHFHPGLLRLIRGVIASGHRQGIAVGMCGEMAADPLATLLLLGMGLREFSVNAPSVSVIHDIIAAHTLAEAQELAETVSKMNDPAEIIEYLKLQRL